MYLHNHKTRFDSDPPSIIVVPLLSVDRILDWNGVIDNYPVMAVTCGDEAEKCASEVLLTARQVCTPTEVEDGRLVLETFVKGIASSVKQHPVKGSFDKEQFSGRGRKDPNLVKGGRFKEELQNRTADVVLPQRHSQFDWDSTHVAKAILSTESSLPDPYLVAVKAAVNYSALCGNKLMPDGSQIRHRMARSTPDNEHKETQMIMFRKGSGISPR